MVPFQSISNSSMKKGFTPQQVIYEWIPSKCTHCAMLRHTKEVCKKKGVVRTEWRRIEKPKAPSQPVINQQSGEQIITNQDPQQSGATTPTTQLPIAGTSQNNMVPTPSRPREASSQEKPSEAFLTVSKGASPKRPSAVSTDSLCTHQYSFSVLSDVHILDVLQDVFQRESMAAPLRHESNCWLERTRP